MPTTQEDYMTWQYDLTMSTRATRAGRMACAGLAALGLSMAVPVMSAQAGVPSKDTLYDTQTEARGGCPAMDWHVAVHPDKSVNGIVSWDSAKHMAHLTGTMENNGAFKANAVESDTKKSYPVTGTVDGSTLKAKITNTGTPCDNEMMAVPQVANGMSKG